MPKKLTLLGALTAALVFGYLGLFNTGTSQGAIQSFTPASFDWNICYGGEFPIPTGGGGVGCGAGSSSTTVPKNTALQSFNIIRLPAGQRLSLPITFTPFDSDGPDNTAGTVDDQWQAATIPCTAGAFNECTVGTDTGDVTSRTDLGCNLGEDVVAVETGAAEPGSDPLNWPDDDAPLDTGEASGVVDEYWTSPAFIRTSQSASLPGGGAGAPTAGSPNFYVTRIHPFPSTFSFQSIDTSELETLYIGGTAPLAIPGGPVLLQLATYQSSYPTQVGLNVSVALLAGEPSNPPSDAFNCLDSPQDSVSTTEYLITPNADRVIPRWNITTSGQDLTDSTQDTILDWQCVTVGAGQTDTDGDCLPDASEPLAASCVGGVNDKDCDNDLVPDGIEGFLGSSPTAADTDGDLATDYEEMFSFTRPDACGGACTDSDGDGQRDKRDDTPTNGTAAGSDAPTTGTDAAGAAPNGIVDDNCPAVANADQRNSDSMWRFHGHPPSFTAPGSGTGDRSNPDEDMFGDACDTDDDNDAINDVAECNVISAGVCTAGVTIASWTGFSGAQTTVCEGPGVAGVSDYVDGYAEDGVDYTGFLNPLLGDVDQDFFLDGRECQLRSRPDQSIRNNVLAENCNVAPTVPLDQGCAQPAANSVGAGGGDEAGGGDRLFLPGGGAGSHSATETFFRTQSVTTGPGVQDNDFDYPQPGCPVPLVDGDGSNGDADRDSDRDMLCPTAGNANPAVLDGIEELIQGTSPSSFDTDQDGCPDGEEILDVSGDGTTSSIDQGIVGGKVLSVGALDNAPADGFLDDYATGINFDLNKDGTVSSIDQGVLGSALTAPQTCLVPAVGWEDNVDIGKATAGLP
jgi:hypothetical protein